jgi:hypothetical protein
MDYSGAIAESWKRMMLLNIVKIRYGDAPVFLEVASIISQYSLETELAGTASWNAFLPEPSQSIGGKGRYADRPTITYNPMLGQNFTKSLLKPIPPSSLASLLQAGYSAEFLLRVCVSAINGIYNQSNQRLKMRKGDPEFDRLIEVMARIQQAGGLGMRIQRQDEEEQLVMFFRKELDDALARDVAEFKRLLKLDQEADTYTLSYGSIAGDDQEIAMLTRSMLQITAEVSALIMVPEEHVHENRASPGVYDEIDTEHKERSRIKILSDSNEPEDAFVAVYFRDHWFFIDDRDFRSKRMFSFLMFIFTLVESGASEKAPTITIPAG